MFAKFDTTHRYYSFSGTTRTDSNSAKLYIHSIIIPDSTTIGVMEQKDLVLSGFILHSNPYILEKNAEFSINLKPTTSQESNNWIIPGVIGVGVATVVFLVANALK
jgi:CHASE1-domain containing sensor protein